MLLAPRSWVQLDGQDQNRWDIYLKYFFVILSKVFISNRLRTRGMAGYGQNIEAQGLIRKIFRNKDLASDLEPLRRSVVENLLVGLSRIWRACSFLHSQ